jgi:hypothetical protein
MLPSALRGDIERLRRDGAGDEYGGDIGREENDGGGCEATELAAGPQRRPCVVIHLTNLQQ